MKARHQGDLAWRFQHAEEQLGATPDAFARVSARERVTRIDAALGTLRSKPVSLARVLARRYGRVETLPEICGVLRENAAVAAMTPEATTWFACLVGEPPRARSHDVRRWLGALCARIRAREATGMDTVAIDEVRRAAVRLLGEAESAYERAAEARR